MSGRSQPDFALHHIMTLESSTPAAQKIGRIVGTFAAHDHDATGVVERTTLVSILLTLCPSATADSVQKLFDELDMPSMGPIPYKQFLVSLFKCTAGEACEVSVYSGNDHVSGIVLVHGSGDCDQLGLGDDVRERKKPTLVKSLLGVGISSVACGGLHTICISTTGQLYSWGCGDDGALGHPCGDNDSQPSLVQLPTDVVIRMVACGDSHSCAIDATDRLWQWGSYRDNDGYVGIALPTSQIAEKTFVPGLVPGVGAIYRVACGAHHTIALSSGNEAFSWGSNQSGQLGLHSGLGCEFAEEVVCGAEAANVPLLVRQGSGVMALLSEHASHIHRVTSVCTNHGLELDASNMGLHEIKNHVAGGSGLRTATCRKVPAHEKHSLLYPQRVLLDDTDHRDARIDQVFASSECSFLTSADGHAYGCGLNSDGQVGVGTISVVVASMRRVSGVDSASWIGGGLHMSAALVHGQVLTWGRPEECGLGLQVGAMPVLTPTLVEGLPPIRALRCGMSHTLACCENGKVHVWGCGVSHQLGNRPRDVLDPGDAGDDPADELAPYVISSKQLDGRVALQAAGGAQHSVELVLDVVQCLQNTVEEEGEAEACGNHAWGEAHVQSAQVGCDESPDDVIVVQTREDFWRVQVEAVYRRRNPYKLDKVPELLEKYEGREAVLYTKVCLKYDLDPSKFYADPSAWPEDSDFINEPEAASSCQDIIATPGTPFGVHAIGSEVPYPDELIPSAVTGHPPPAVFEFGKPQWTRPATEQGANTSTPAHCNAFDFDFSRPAEAAPSTEGSSGDGESGDERSEAIRRRRRRTVVKQDASRKLKQPRKCRRSPY